MISQERIRLRYIWAMAGILFAAVFAAMSASGSYNPKQLLDHGQAYDFSKESLELKTKTCAYDEETGIFTVLSASARKTFSKMPARQWKYLDFEVENLNTGYAVWNIVYLNQDKKEIARQETGIVNGINTVGTVCAEAFRYIRIEILNQPGQQFSLKSARAHTGLMVSFSDWIKHFIGYLMLYALLSLAWLVAKNGGMRVLLETMQHALAIIGDFGGSRCFRRFSGVQRNRLRTFLFAVLFLGMIASNALGIYNSDEGYRFCLVFVTAIFFGVSFLLWEKPLETIGWRGNTAFFWFAYWGMVCVMDFLKDKHYRYTGYVCLAGMTLLFLAWSQCENPAKLWRNMINGLIAAFPPVMAFCALFRGKRVGVLYNGIFTNREDMSLYSVTMLGIFLAALAERLLDGGDRSRKKNLLKIFALSAGVSLCAHNLYISWTPMCVLAGALLLTCFLIWLTVKRKSLRSGAGKTLMLLAAAAACSLIIVLPMHALMNHAPQALGTDMKFSRDILESYVPKSVMKLAEQTRPGMYQGVRCIAKAEKSLVWKAYVREIDLIGNKPRLLVAQHRTMANSGWLELAYRYGIFILLPFLGMWGAALGQGARKRSFGLCLLFFGYHLMFLTQNMEKPFLQPLWTLAYLGIGYCFMAHNKNLGAREAFRDEGKEEAV